MTSSTSAWVYLFSKFTPEALLFEALCIFLLLFAYAAFWVMKKRRFGVVENQVPAGVVKVYLNELIEQANTMRVQLFGLLSSAGVDPASLGGGSGAYHGGGGAPIDMAQLQAAIQAAMAANGAQPMSSVSVTNLAASGDPAAAQLAQRLTMMESQFQSQAKAMESITIEKQKLEKALADAKANGGGKAGAGGSAGGGNSDLEKRLKELQDRLEEYSIIEDDLANLKRLQQENAALKAALAAAGGSAGAVAAAPAAPAAEEAPSEAPPEVAAEAAPAEDPQAAVDAAMAAAEEAPPAPESTEPLAVPAEEFEALVDQVEKSLEAPAAEAEAAPALADLPSAAEQALMGTKTEDAPAPTGPPAMDQNDSDLVAEFEKMLNS